MSKIALGSVVSLVLMGMFGLFGILLFFTGGATAVCQDSKSGVVVSPTGVSLSSASLTVRGAAMDTSQAKIAAQIAGIVAARKNNFPDSVQRRVSVIALITGIVESSLRNLNYGDRDSLGVFQQRPSQGWGTAEQVTNVTYATNKFLDALLAVPGWQTRPLGDVAQSVQRSGFPDRYAIYIPEAERIYNQLVFKGTPSTFQAVDYSPGCTSSQNNGSATGPWQSPLPAGSYVITDGYGPRVHPVTGVYGFHNGVDLAAPSGTPISAAHSGTVVRAGYDNAWGNYLAIAGGGVTLLYPHESSFAAGIHVGQQVQAGERIGSVGATGYVTGPHLHLTVCTNLSLCIRGSGANGQGSVEPLRFFKSKGVSL